MADQRSRRTTHPLVLSLILAVVLLCGRTTTLRAQPAATGKPNIVIIWGDDIGITDISAYSHGLMGFQTPNIDRVAHDGMMFTDYYGEQSCTAGRAAFLTGQSVFRTGNSKVGLPGAVSGCKRKTQQSPNCSSRSATPPASSARTISGT